MQAFLADLPDFLFAPSRGDILATGMQGPMGRGTPLTDARFRARTRVAREERFTRDKP